jgi:hypothetical protein
MVVMPAPPEVISVGGTTVEKSTGAPVTPGTTPQPHTTLFASIANPWSRSIAIDTAGLVSGIASGAPPWAASSDDAVLGCAN